MTLGTIFYITYFFIRVVLSWAYAEYARISRNTKAIENAALPRREDFFDDFFRWDSPLKDISSKT